MTTPRDQIASDLKELSAIEHRYSASEGERAMLHDVRGRIPSGQQIVVEGFVAHTSPAIVVGIHVGMLLVLGILGLWFPGWGVLGTVLVTLSLLGEGTGRFSTLRWLMVKAASYNLVYRSRGSIPMGSVVITTPLDVSRWQTLTHPWLGWSRRPLQLVFGAALVMAILMLLRVLGEPLGPRTRDLHIVSLVVLVVTVVMGIIVHRRKGSGKDSASGPVVLLELIRRLQANPIPNVDVWIAFLGCSRAFQGGMRHFLSLHRKSLFSPTLVVSVDEPGRIPLMAVTSEGSIVQQDHRPTGPALVERLRWAGVHLSETRKYGATDARAALVAGYRALSLSGGSGEATVDSTTHAADVVETLVRWYAKDVAQVEGDRPELEKLAVALRALREPSASAPASPSSSEEDEHSRDEPVKVGEV